MSFLFFFTRPMKLSDRKMLLKTSGKSRGPTTASEAALCTHEWGNVEKSYLSRTDCRLCKEKIPSLEEKVKIFRKSELQIGALIHRSLGVDLGVYTGSENLAICCLRYNMLNAYNKALKKSTRSSMASSRNLKVTDLSVSKDYRTPTCRLKFCGDHHYQQA